MSVRSSGSNDPRDEDSQLLTSTGRRAEAEQLAARTPMQLDPIQALMGPPAPVWENQETSKQRDGRCVVYHGATRCSSGVHSRVWIGCTTGEHLDYSELCEPHAAQLETGGTSFSCRRCWDALNIISRATVIRIERIDDEQGR